MNSRSRKLLVAFVAAMASGCASQTVGGGYPQQLCHADSGPIAVQAETLIECAVGRADDRAWSIRNPKASAKEAWTWCAPKRAAVTKITRHCEVIMQGAAGSDFPTWMGRLHDQALEEAQEAARHKLATTKPGS